MACSQQPQPLFFGCSFGWLLTHVHKNSDFPQPIKLKVVLGYGRRPSSRPFRKCSTSGRLRAPQKHTGDAREQPRIFKGSFLTDFVLKCLRMFLRISSHEQPVVPVSPLKPPTKEPEHWWPSSPRFQPSWAARLLLPCGDCLDGFEQQCSAG